MKKYEDIPGSDKKLKIEVFYDKGGTNYYNGSISRRGYYVSVKVVKIEQGSGYTTESSMMFSGLKRLLLEVKRQSSKHYDTACEMANTIDLSEMKQRVINDPASIK